MPIFFIKKFTQCAHFFLACAIMFVTIKDFVNEGGLLGDIKIKINVCILIFLMIIMIAQ